MDGAVRWMASGPNCGLAELRILGGQGQDLAQEIDSALVLAHVHRDQPQQAEGQRRAVAGLEQDLAEDVREGEIPLLVGRERGPICGLALLAERSLDQVFGLFGPAQHRQRRSEVTLDLQHCSIEA